MYLTLIALDPITTPDIEKEIKNTIKSGDASYVQVIHTSANLGVWDQIGDIDVYVKYEAEANLGYLNDDHGLAFFIHLATSTKRLFITAEQGENGIGTITKRAKTGIKMNECLVGVYGTLKVNQRGKKFGLSLVKRNSMFFGGIGKFREAKIVSAIKNESTLNDPDNECMLCCENKRKAILFPCRHQQTCVDCWNRWKNEAISLNRCPYCKQYVEEYVEQ